MRTQTGFEERRLTRAVLDKFDFGFAENGLTAYRLNKELPSNSFIKYVGEEQYKKMVNFILRYLSDVDIPFKRCVESRRVTEVADDPQRYVYRVPNGHDQRFARRS